MGTVKKEEAKMTSEEMLARSSSWTLACDNALLNRLKSFSDNLSRNAQELTKECDALSKDISHLDYKLRNVTNEFLMISNTQFVENRVEEFEEFSASLTTPTTPGVGLKSKSEMEAELISKMKLAIQLGLKACDFSSQNEAESNTEKSFRLKRPYLIGSPKFFSSKYCGLVDESRRVVPFDSLSEADSVSISPSQNEIFHPQASQDNKPIVTFTMPPTPAVPIFKVPENGPVEGTSHTSFQKNQNENIHDIGSRVVPPSPTISDRSSKPGSSNASLSRENAPKSVTDELNKIYGAFSPPPNADDDSDDDFRPNASAGRIFEDDDDDLLGENKLFPSSQKNTVDFFGRSNPSQLPTPPVLCMPPPVNPVPQLQQQSAFRNNSNGNMETLVGPSPKSNDIPNLSNVPADDSSNSRKDVSKNEATLPDVEVSAARPKLPPGAVLMFTGLPPPHVSNANTLKATPSTTKSEPASSLPSNKQTTLSNSFPHKKTSIQQLPSTSANIVGASSSHQHQENVNTKQNASQPSVVSSTHSKSIDSAIQGSLSSSTDSRRVSANTVPSTSLFLDDSSSDEDIFKSNKKYSKPNLLQGPSQTHITQKSFQPRSEPAFSTVSNQASTSASSRTLKGEVKNPPVKKSIFDDSDSDDDLFASKTTAPTTNHNARETKSASKEFFKYEPKRLAVTGKSTKSSSLFGDDSDSDTDLFGNKKSSSTASAIKSTSVVTPVPVPIIVSAKPEMDVVINEDTVPPQPLRNSTTEEHSVLNQNNNEVVIDGKSDLQTKVSTTSDEIINEQLENKKMVKSKSIKKSIFDDSDSEDDLFSSKKSVKINKTSKVDEDNDDLFGASSTNNVLNSQNKTTSNTVPKQVSLFGEESDSDNDIFISKKSKSNTDKEALEQVKENVEDGINRKSGKEFMEPATLKQSEDSVKETVKVEDDADIFKQVKDKTKNIPEVGDTLDSISSVNPKTDSSKSTKAVGSKISEKIKAMQTPKSEALSKSEKDSEGSSKPQIKSKISVKNLALNLKINPLALKVGAKPPKLSGSTPSTPDKEFTDVPLSPTTSTDDTSESTPTSARATPTSSMMNHDTAATTEASSTGSPSISPNDDLNAEQILKGATKGMEEDDFVDNRTVTSFNDGGDHFVEIIKSRAKIPQKRRPPSKTFLKRLTIPEVEEAKSEEPNKTDDNDDKNEDAIDGKDEQSEKSEATT